MNYFGTDGIRGTYGSTLTDDTAFLLGKSLTYGNDGAVVVVARDTRVSGENLFRALSQGVYSGGGNVINLGVLPTNAVGHFVRKFGGDYGVMISASHNQPTDNGLKVFDKYGIKLCENMQNELSQIMGKYSTGSQQFGNIYEPVFCNIDSIYVNDVLSKFSHLRLDGEKVALDCCYGASFLVAPKVFEALGATVSAFCNSPCGDKINVDCGATHTDFLYNSIKNGNYKLGFSFDGDADRLAVFYQGEYLSNNRVFFAIAKYLQQTNDLPKNTVCGTVLTNGGVEQSLNKLGIKLIRSNVGDTNVFNTMLSNGISFGGEESGHYLLGNYATSSDAIINALLVCQIYSQVGDLFDYTKECVDLPFSSESFVFTQSNVSCATESVLKSITNDVANKYPTCRVVLRKSGTENKIRAYVEGDKHQDAMQQIRQSLKVL